MKTAEYAIVDIETTGGNAGGSRITEIAIIIFDGERIIDRFETLVNPQKQIPLPIFALTGINNEMVKAAPVFGDIAEKVFQMLSDRIFVAHSVNFDYSFVRHELEQAGFRWTAKKLCTVRAARKIKPGFSSYSLGNICRSLDIPIENRHRAGGDADATAILLSRLLHWDAGGEIAQMIKKTSKDQRLPPNLPPQDFDSLPEKPGVYYFYNSAKQVIYVGKAVNIKKRVASHFSGHTIKPQRQHFMRDIFGISFEVCGTELMALLLECTEIKKLWPPYNKASKRFETKYGLYGYEARNGYRYLAVGKLGKHQRCIKTFHNEFEAVNCLLGLSRKFGIDRRFCVFGKTPEGELPLRSDLSELPPAEKHNHQIEEAVESLSSDGPSFAIWDKGRSDDERSCIWVEKGGFYGMGYIASDISIQEPLQVKDHLTRYRSNQYVEQMIFSFAEKNPGKVRFLNN